MYSNPKLSKRILSFLLMLSLVLNIVLSSGILPVTVRAEGSETPVDDVFYVDGVEKDGADGKSKDAAFATVAEAYAKIRNAKDTDKTTIVICGAVNMADSAAQVGNYKGFSAHKGEVVFTSKYADIDYRDGKTDVVFTLDTSWALFGNTTFQDITIAGDNTTVFADYNNLTLGEGVTGTFAKIVYLGTQSNIYYAVNEAVVAKDVVFTMKSGTIGTLECFGLNDQGYKNGLAANARSYNVTLDINGGNIGTVQATYNEKYVYPKINNFNAILGNGAAAIDWTGVVDSERVIGTKTVEYKDVTDTMPATTGFDVLKLTNSNVTVPSLDSVTSIVMNDASQLTLTGAAPTTYRVGVTLEMAGNEWNTTEALITAPAGTEKAIFALTNTGIAWKYASGENATWQIDADSIETPVVPAGNVFYVDGTGAGEKDGTSAANAFATVAEAYNKIPDGAKKTTIVICGNVTVNKGATFLSGGTTSWYLPSHDGEVVFTSVYGDEDYRSTSGIRINPYMYLLGDTAFENIVINERAAAVYTNYNSLRLGEGVDVSANADKVFATTVYLGTTNAMYTAVEGTEQGNIRAEDVVFTMESGAIGTLNACSSNQIQGAENDKAGLTYNATLNIKGGSIGTLTADNTSTYTNLSIEDLDVIISGNAEVTTLTLATTIDRVSGTATVEYKGTIKNKMPVATGFDVVKLTHAKVTVSSLDSATTGIVITDDSQLTVTTAPTETVKVTVRQVGAELNTTSELIIANGGVFELTNGTWAEGSLTLSAVKQEFITDEDGDGKITVDANGQILDLKGQNITVTLANGVELAVIDTGIKQNADGTVSGGKLTVEGEGTIAPVVIDPASKMRFLAVQVEGGYQFLPFNLTISRQGINTLAKNPTNPMEFMPVICIRATFMAFNQVMDKIEAYGFVVGDEKYSMGKDFTKNLTHAYADLHGSLGEGIDKEGSIQAFITIDGVTYTSAVHTFKPAEIWSAINGKIESGAINATQAQLGRLAKIK